MMESTLDVHQGSNHRSAFDLCEAAVADALVIPCFFIWVCSPVYMYIIYADLGADLGASPRDDSRKSLRRSLPVPWAANQFSQILDSRQNLLLVKMKGPSELGQIFFFIHSTPFRNKLRQYLVMAKESMKLTIRLLSMSILLLQIDAFSTSMFLKESAVRGGRRSSCASLKAHTEAEPLNRRQFAKLGSFFLGGLIAPEITKAEQVSNQFGTNYS
jgi:hypothetical protein